MNKIMIFGMAALALLITVLILSTCSNPFTAGLGEKVDLDAPQLEITSHHNGDAVGDVFDLSGSINDDGIVKSVTVSISYEGSVIGTGSAVVTNSSWNFNYNSNGLSDGDHEFLVVATDDTDKTVSRKVLLTVDNNPPTVIVTVPSQYNLLTNDLAAGIPNQDITVELNKLVTIKGEAADTTRVKDVRISLYDASTDAPIFVDQLATGTSSWYYTFDSSGNPNTDYYFFVKATDFSDNENTYFYHFFDILSLASDPADLPNIEEINATEFEAAVLGGSLPAAQLLNIRHNTTAGEQMIITIDQDSDLPDIEFINPDPLGTEISNVLGSPQRFNGFVSDDDPSGIDETTVKIAFWLDGTQNDLATYPDGDNDADPNNGWFSPTVSGNQWSYEPSPGLGVGTYWVRLKASDYNANETISEPVGFTISASTPSVQISGSTTPGGSGLGADQGDYLGIGQNIRVEAKVTGMSSGSVYLDWDDDGTYEIELTQDGGNPELWYTDMVEGTTQDDGLTETFGIGLPGSIPEDGPVKLHVQAGAAPDFGIATLQIVADSALPGASIDLPPDDEIINDIYVFRGEAWDNEKDLDTGYLNQVLIAITDQGATKPADLPSTILPLLGDFTIPVTGTYNWQADIDTTDFTDNHWYTITVLVDDTAGNSSDPTAPAAYSIMKYFKIDQSSDNPNFTLSGGLILGESTATNNALGLDPWINGTVSDDDAVDSTSIQYQIWNDAGDTRLVPVGLGDSGDGWNNISDPPAADSQTVFWDHHITGLPAASYTLEMRAKDENGIFADNWISTKFLIDVGPPSITISAPANNAIFNTTFDILGTIADDTGIKELKIVFDGVDETILWADDLNDTNDPTTVYIVLPVDNDTPEEVSFVYTVETSDPWNNDGDHAYQVVATDTGGATTTKDLQVIVDAEPPTLSFTNPGVGTVVNGNGIQIRGNADDNRTVTAVYIDITDGAAPGGAYDTWVTYPVTGAYSWQTQLDSLILVPDSTITPKTIYAVVVDGAGNASPVGTYTLPFTINQESDRPIISFNDIDKTETVATNNVLVGATNLTGIIEDDDLVDSSTIEINFDGGGWGLVSDPPADGKVVVWKHDISATGENLSEGTHYVKVRVRDNQSNGTVADGSDDGVYNTNFNWNIADNTDPVAEPLGVPFILNIGPPSITITGPANYSYHNSDVTISGNATDANGVQNMFISTDNGLSWEPPDNFTPTIDASAAPWDYTLAVDSGGADDGTYSYLIRAVDNYGATGVENGQFTVDATNPGAAIILPANGSTVNGSITYTGTSSDNIQVSQVYVARGLTANADPAGGDPAGDPLYLPLGSTYSWSLPLDTTTVNNTDSNVSYYFSVVSVDAADNVSARQNVNIIINQNSDKPVISYSSIIEAGTFVQNLIPASKQVAGMITDDDGVDASTIQYRLYQEDGTTLITDWTDISASPGADSTYYTWTYTFGVTDGKYQMMLRAADINAGEVYNIGEFDWNESSLVKFAVDTANPVTTFDTSNGGSTNTDLLISGTASDANGVTDVDISFDGGTIWLPADTFTPGASSVWDYTFDIDEAGHTNDGLLTYQIRLIDEYGKEQVYDRYITIDTTPATVVINQPASGTDTNGIITIRGTSGDTGAGVSDVYYNIQTTASGEPVYPGTYSAASGIYNWSDTYNTSAITGPTSYTLWVRAVDLAGNLSTASSIAFNIDQSSDKPVIEYSSITEGGTFGDNELPLSKKISGTIEDDDGVDASTVQFQLYQEDGTTLIDNWTDISGQPASDTTFTSWSHTLGDTGTSVGDGKYQIRLRAADTNDAGAYDGSYDWTVSPLQQITVDTTFPTGSIDTLEVTSPYGAGVDPRAAASGMLVYNSFDLIGTATDGNGVTSVSFSTDGTNFVPVDTFSEPNWDHTVAITRDGSSDGALTLYIRIQDTVGKITDKTLNITIDTVEPTGVWDYTNELVKQAGITTFAGTNAKLIGSVEDTGDISNVDRVDLFFVKDSAFYSPRAATSIATGGNSIPTDSSYIISVDNRFEIDSDSAPGDGDGFLEGLRSKGTYDEWYTYIDSTILPDGPLAVHFANYDGSGNRSIVTETVQISNYPPSIWRLDIFGSQYTESDVKVKLDGTGNIIMNVSDTGTGAGIDATTYELEVMEQYNVDNGDVKLPYITSYDAADTYLYDTSDPEYTASGTFSFDTSDFAAGYYYRIQTRIKDDSENIVTKDFYMWVYDSANDTFAPTVTIDELTQSNVGSSGHIDGTVAGVADVSGIIILTGTVYDDAISPTVTVEINDSSGWTTYVDAATVTNQTGTLQTGFTYDWSYSWDSSTINGIAETGVDIRVYGTDTKEPVGNSTAEGDRPVLTVDVVPYITDILTGLEFGIKSFVKRSALGRYTVANNSIITIKGYNLAADTAGSVEIGGISYTPQAGSTSTEQIIDLNDSTNSGPLTVTTNGFASINNTNDNDLDQNSEVIQYYPDMNDDRYISLWALTNTGFSGGNAVMKPTDDSNSDNIVDDMDWMYTVGSDALFMNSTLMTESFTLSGGDFEYNTSGTRIWTFLNNSRWWGDPANDNWEFYGSVQWSIETPSPYSTDGYAAYNFNVLGDRMGLGNLRYNGTGDLSRYHNIQIEVNGTDTSTDNYVAYYDSSGADEGIVFMGFTAGTTIAGATTALSTWETSISKTVNNTTAYAIAGTEKNARNMGINDPTYNSDSSNVREVLVATTHSSEDFKLAFDSVNDVLYMAWYDPADDALKLMYTTSPDAEHGAWADWSNGTDNIVVSSAGTHIDMIVDPAGGVHMAFLNGTTGFLDYAYISGRTDTSADHFTVDALFNAGQYTGLDIRDFGGLDYRPVITSLSSAFLGTNVAVRMSYPVSALGIFGNGADSSTGNYSGDWEVIAVPAATIPLAANSFVEMTHINQLGNPMIGYNGTYMEEATYLGF